MKYKDYDLPTPQGYWLLIEMDNKYVGDGESEYKTTGGIIVTETVVRQDNYGMSIGTVVCVGKDAYKEYFKSKTGATVPWCKEGDRVLVEAHSGRNVPYVTGKKFTHGQFQLITDQNICGTYN